mmetsp:Transcript_58164/g.125732  ORF Transcript_58164/g.125732 Transcript_58164/m.125732 type:complete len:125 (-) Transcript_58164:85-459(-)
MDVGTRETTSRTANLETASFAGQMGVATWGNGSLANSTAWVAMWTRTAFAGKANGMMANGSSGFPTDLVLRLAQPALVPVCGPDAAVAMMCTDALDPGYCWQRMGIVSFFPLQSSLEGKCFKGH